MMAKFEIGSKRKQERLLISTTRFYKVSSVGYCTRVECDRSWIQSSVGSKTKKLWNWYLLLLHLVHSI